MHPLTIFPQLLNFSFFAPFLLRITVALFIFFIGRNRLKKQYSFAGYIYMVSALLVFLGLYTQIAVVLGVATLKFDFYFDYWKNRNTVPVPMEKYFLYALAGVILLTLIVTGPGAFAMDLPL